MIISGPVADQVDEIPVLQAEIGEVLRMDEYHVAAALDPAIAVVETVDRGVELIMAAQGLQDQLARLQLQHLDGDTANSARPDLVGNVRLSRGGCGMTKPPGRDTLAS